MSKKVTNTPIMITPLNTTRLYSKLHEWCEENIIIGANQGHLVVDLYATYKKDMLEKDLLPLLQKTFVSRLKQIYFLEIQEAKVLFVYKGAKGSSQVRGLGLKGSHSKGVGSRDLQEVGV